MPRGGRTRDRAGRRTQLAPAKGVRAAPGQPGRRQNARGVGLSGRPRRAWMSWASLQTWQVAVASLRRRMWTAPRRHGGAACESGRHFRRLQPARTRFDAVKLRPPAVVSPPEMRERHQRYALPGPEPGCTRRDDAEIVRHHATVGTPFPGPVLAPRGQDCLAERPGRGVAPFLGRMPFGQCTVRLDHFSRARDFGIYNRLGRSGSDCRP